MEDEKNIINAAEDAAVEEEKEETPEEKAARKKAHFKAELLDWGKTLLYFCVIPVIIFECFCFVARVPTNSMDPTVPAGAQVLVTRSFNKDNIERGDIVVFSNEELNLLLFKRCIGLPGDTVDFDGTGNTYLNGELFEEPYVSTVSSYVGTFTVPEDCYLFLGDNRTNSWDARYWDNPYINKKFVQGKARFVFFPFNAIGTVE